MAKEKGESAPTSSTLVAHINFAYNPSWWEPIQTQDSQKHTLGEQPLPDDYSMHWWIKILGDI